MHGAVKTSGFGREHYLFCDITLLNNRDIEIKLKGVGIDDEWLLNDSASKPRPI